MLMGATDNAHDCLRMLSVTLAIVEHCAHVHCGSRSHYVHCCALLGHCFKDVGQCTVVCGKGHWTMIIAHGCTDIGNGDALCALLRGMEYGSLLCSIKL